MSQNNETAMEGTMLVDGPTWPSGFTDSEY
jgi:hypothetical protein